MVSSDEIRRRLEAKRRGETPSEEKTVVEGTVNCPECQTPNLPQAKFCVGCGKPLPKEESKTVPPVQNITEEATNAPSATETGKEPDFKVCPSCNQKNKLNAKFCIICGHKFEEGSGDENVTPETVTPETVIEENESTTPPETAVQEGNESTSSPEVIEPSSEDDNPYVETSERVIIESSEIRTSDTPVEKPAETVETPVEAAETPVIPEIKVPEHLKSDETKKISESESVPDSETVEIPDAVESNEESAHDVDPVEKIKKAKELLDIGAITQEEFDNIKNKYLEQI